MTLRGKNLFAVKYAGQLRYPVTDGFYRRVPEAEPDVVGAFAGRRELGAVVVADSFLEDLFLHRGQVGALGKLHPDV